MNMPTMDSKKADMVRAENEVESLKQKVADLSRQRDQIQNQIDQKVANANIIMSEERSKIDAERRFVQGEREKLEQGKKEVSAQIESLKSEKSAFEKERETSQKLLAAAKFAKTNVDQFIIAVQRAYSVLGG